MSQDCQRYEAQSIESYWAKSITLSGVVSLSSLVRYSVIAEDNLPGRSCVKTPPKAFIILCTLIWAD